jgi:hypothetical protein
MKLVSIDEILIEKYKIDKEVISINMKIYIEKLLQKRK